MRASGRAGWREFAIWRNPIQTFKGSTTDLKSVFLFPKTIDVGSVAHWFWRILAIQMQEDTAEGVENA